MCLNGWGGRLFDALVDYLRAEEPDLLCLQEVVHTPAAQTAWLEYRDGDHVLPQRANLFAELRAALPDHAAIFCPAAQGLLWDGETGVPSQWGLATFLRTSYPLIGQVQGFVHKDFSPDGYGAHPRSRCAHAVRFYDPVGRRTICAAHMHGLRDPGAGKADTPDRLAQAVRFAALIRAAARPGDRLVACGDFNVEPGSATFGTLGTLGLADLVTGRGFTDTRGSHYAKPGRFADYMLVETGTEVTGFDVVASPEVSDHRPLLLEI